MQFARNERDLFVLVLLVGDGVLLKESAVTEA